MTTNQREAPTPHVTTIETQTVGDLTLYVWTCPCGRRGMPNSDEASARRGAAGHEQKSGPIRKPPV